MHALSTKCGVHSTNTSYGLKIRLLLLCVVGILLPVLTYTAETDELPERYTVTVVEGGNLTVTCNVTSSPELEVFWTRNNSASPFIQHGVSLEIPDILRASSGDYVCHCYNTSSDDHNVTVEVVTVDVHYPAKMTMRTHSQTVHEGALLSIECSWEANPPADILLINNNTGTVYVNAKQGSGSFQHGFSTVKCRGWGVYICTGNNYLNDGVNSTAIDNATVLCAPRWDPSHTNVEYTLKARIESINNFFYMYYLAFPPPNVTWEHGGEILPRSMFYDFPAERATLLNISHVDVADYGNYTLKLTNEFGTFAAVYELIPLGPPLKPTNLRDHNVTSHSVRLTWTGGYDMGSQQTFIVIDMDTYLFLSPPIYDNSTTHGIGAKFTYTQESLHSDTPYNLSIFARNENMAMSYPAVPVRFRTNAIPHTDKAGSIHRGLITGTMVGGLCAVKMCRLLLHL